HRRRHAEVVAVVLEPLSHLDHVAVARGRQQADPRALALEEGVGGDRGAVDHALGLAEERRHVVAERPREQLEALQHALRGVGRRRGGLGERDAAGVVDRDQVREGPADVDADPVHGSAPPRAPAPALSSGHDPVGQILRAGAVVSIRSSRTEPRPPRNRPSPPESGRNSWRAKKRGKRVSVTSMLPNLMPPAAWPSPAVGHPSPAAEAPPPPRAWNRCQMNGRSVRGLTPWRAMRKRLDQPAMTRSGHERARALSTASAMSWAQWFVQSVTGAGGSGQTIDPGRARTLTGRNVPAFFGVRGSSR